MPTPGDTAVITTGTVVLTANTGPNLLFENGILGLGGTAHPTLLLKNDAPTGQYFTVAITGSATIEANGNRGVAGSITGAPNDGSTITLKADPGGELVLLQGGSLNVADREVDFVGNVTLERNAMISGNIAVDGTLSVLAGRTVLASNLVTGTGTIVIGGYGELSPSALPATQTVVFAGQGGILDLNFSLADSFHATVEGFAPGDFIDFVGFGTVNAVTLDATSHVLTIGDDTGRSYLFENFLGAAGPLTAVREANGSDLIGYTGHVTPLAEQIDAGARAMHADLAQTMTIPGTTTRITGAGIKVGIISDSFNRTGGYAADTAAGYLPAGVTVLREGLAGARDEGRAMAELIHQTAPGAALFFAASGATPADFAASVRALQAAGCTVIVDDIAFAAEPYFQLGSPAENAISDVVAAGVSYVSSAGNFGDTFYERAFTTTPQTLADGSTVQAIVFGNGTTSQSITAVGGQSDTIELQWDAPFYGVGGVASDQPGSVAFKVYDPATGALVGTSSQVRDGGHLVAESELTLPGLNTSATYNLVIYHVDGTPDVGRVKYVITGVSAGGATAVGGRINERDAGVGSGAVSGHQLVPGIITVAAQNVVNTPAFGRTPDYTEPFSSTGAGTLLFDANGNRLDQPLVAGVPDVTGPDGVQTSVTGFTPFFGTSAAAPNVAGVIALMQQVQAGITPALVGSILAQSALPLTGETAASAGAGLVQADRAILLEEGVACYCAGTLIRTDQGDREVEALEAGDMAVTAFGRLAPVLWVGRRSYTGQFLASRLHLQPVLFRAGSLGGALPQRDLLVSPEHAMFLDGLLIPARHLVNGATIVQERGLKQVDYFHVELDSHDLVLAEGSPSESFVDDDSRGMFHNVTEWNRLHPGRKRVPAVFCAPRVESGPELDAIRRRLAGASVHEVQLGEEGLHRVTIPVDAFAVRLVTASGYAAGDQRRLGAAVSRIAIDGVATALSDPKLTSGWHPCEGTWRWTDGTGLVLVAGAREIEVTVAALLLAAAA